jgi:phosphatidylserine/phosphatidylglycerophosphate/cardiolipin synthase-like enzyme
MERATRPLEIVLILPDKSKRFKDRVAMGFAQRRILERLTAAAKRYHHQLGVYYSAAPSEAGDVPVFVHSKVLSIDDRFLLVSSANATNRSMGFDSELGIAWEADAPTPSLRSARIELLGEHCGLPRERAHALLAATPGLVGRLDELARSKAHRLRIHDRNTDERPGPLLSKLLPEATPFDPESVRAFRQSLPHPTTWLRRKPKQLGP